MLTSPMGSSIINSFWHEKHHERICRLTPEEHLEFRKLHSSVLSPGSRMSINPLLRRLQHPARYRTALERRGRSRTFQESNWRDEKLTRPTGEGHEETVRSAYRRVRHHPCCANTSRRAWSISWTCTPTACRRSTEKKCGWCRTPTGGKRPRYASGQHDQLRHPDHPCGRRGLSVGAVNCCSPTAYDGKPLDPDYTGRTLKNIQFLWKRPGPSPHDEGR